MGLITPHWTPGPTRRGQSGGAHDARRADQLFSRTEARGPPGPAGPAAVTPPV